MRRRTHRALVALLVVAAHGAGATSVAAQIFDARSMGMGGVTLPGRSGDAARVNPARRATPAIDVPYGRTIPLPIGLLRAIGDVPPFDPDDEDFDLIAVADFVWNFPWALQIGAPESGSRDVVLDVSRDAVTIDLGRAREQVPREGFDAGEMRTLFELGRDLPLGPRYGHLYVGALQGWELDLVEVDLDDATVGVLRDGEPVVGGRTYRIDARGTAQIGLSSQLVYAREIGLGRGRATDRGDDWLDAYWDGPAQRPRLWAGIGVRRYFGIAAVDLDGDLSLRGDDPLLEDTSRFFLESEIDYVRATPRGLANLGTAWALDLGAVLRWRSFEFGAGVADLFAVLHWDRGEIDRIVYDELSDGFVQQTVDDRARITTRIPHSWRLDASWRRDPRTLVAADVSKAPGGIAWHLGGERWLDARWALRSGVELDRRGFLQAGAGAGLRLGRMGVDVGLRSHSRNVPGKRMLELGIALVFGGAAR